MKAEYELLDSLFDELFPLMRSITGPGIEKSMELFSRYMPLKLTKTATGTEVYDWTVPQEWHFKSARLTGPDGKTVCDASDLNLHVVNYSSPVDITIPLEELDPHLHSLPHLPEAVPYVTSYYKRQWGFCLAHSQRVALKAGLYHAKIEASFIDGGVPIAQCKLEGDSEKEVLLTSYLCHPSLANNELSGPLTLLSLYLRLQKWPKRRFSYRFLLNPETIGALCFLYAHGKELKENLIAGMVLSCTGGPSKGMVYKASRRADSLLDITVGCQRKQTLLPIEKTPFTPLFGSDERQYCSPGFNLPVGQMSRTRYGLYKGYHNSLDTKEFMGIKSLIESASTIEQVLKYAEVIGNPVNLAPFGEPQLGKRDLYPKINSHQSRTMSNDEILDGRTQLNRILTLLNMADGSHSLIEIADACNCTIDELLPTLELLEKNNLIGYNRQLDAL